MIYLSYGMELEESTVCLSYSRYGDYSHTTLLKLLFKVYFGYLSILSIFNEFIISGLALLLFSIYMTSLACLFFTTRRY